MELHLYQGLNEVYKAPWLLIKMNKKRVLVKFFLQAAYFMIVKI